MQRNKSQFHRQNSSSLRRYPTWLFSGCMLLTATPLLTFAVPGSAFGQQEEVQRATAQEEITSRAQESRERTERAQQRSEVRLSAVNEGKIDQLSDFHLASWILLENEVQLQVSRMAADRAQNPQVKEFAQRMVQAHSQLVHRLHRPLRQFSRRGAGGEFDFAEVLEEVTRRLDAVDDRRRLGYRGAEEEPAGRDELQQERRDVRQEREELRDARQERDLLDSDERPDNEANENDDVREQREELQEERQDRREARREAGLFNRTEEEAERLQQERREVEEAREDLRRARDDRELFDRDRNERTDPEDAAVRREREELREEREERRAARRDRRLLDGDAREALRQNLPEILGLIGEAVEAADQDTVGLPFIQLKRQLAHQNAQSMVTELKRQPEGDFDQGYLGFALAHHLRMIDTMTVAKRHASPELSRVLDDSIVSMQEHLGQARQLMQAIGTHDKDASQARDAAASQNEELETNQQQ